VSSHPAPRHITQHGSHQSIPRDESSDFSVVIGVRSTGHDVVSITETMSGLGIDLFIAERVLNRVREGIDLRAVDSSQHPFDLILSWRNQSLHGSESLKTIGGTILNLSLLISIDELQLNFEPRFSNQISLRR
jgi:hypothetical protein